MSGESAENEKSQAVQTCPYLDTIDRTALDFDFEPACSQSLSTSPNIYACLVCGAFFKGRGKQTPAYLHSVNENHSVFLHLTRGTFHCLPDDYEIVDPSLDDIQKAFRPIYSEKDIQDLDNRKDLGRDLFGRRYLPGYVGLNNLNKTDCINATLQALAHVKKLRDFFLRCGDGVEFELILHVASSASSKKRKRKRNGSLSSKDTKKKVVVVDPTSFSHLAKCFGEMIRKMWNDKRFKSTVDPHMLVQAISVASNKRYSIGKQIEAGEFIAWLLHQLHHGVGGTKKAGSSIIHQLFQGSVEITTRQRKLVDENVSEEEDDRLGSDNEDDITKKVEAAKKEKEMNTNAIEENVSNSQFLQLTLDIPEKPLFKDDNGGLVIPQEPLPTLLKKFDGVSFNDVLGAPQAQQRRYRLTRLPNYLILCLSRFKKNSFNNEKNPTIVPFPITNFDLTRYVMDPQKKREPPTEDQIREMSVKELKGLLQNYGQSALATNVVEKSELLQLCIDFIAKSLPDLLSQKYDLVANITHTIPAEVGREGLVDPLEEGSYRCHVEHKSTKQWFEIQDLHVQEIMPQLIGVSESYVLIFEKKITSDLK